jgi:hypothetical protein
MFRHLIVRAAVLAALPFLFASCGGDSAGPSDLASDGGATVRGQFDAASGTFEFRTGRAPDTDGRGFLLRGSDVRWSEEDAALLVDFTVLNDTENTYPEPVVLTFLQLLPEGTTVNNSDNSETGAGAQILFDFENEDDQWSPGEESLARTVMFGTDEGTAVAFVARIDVGLEPGAGTIGGIVWHDVDGDGEIDDDEPGLGDVAVMLLEGGDELLQATTDSDGSYRFDSLPAGAYLVRPVATEGWVATTAAEINVVLPDGGSFLAANFGCRREDDGGGDPSIEVGDRVHAKGTYQDDPDRLVATQIEVCRPEGDDRSRKLGRLCGPATDVDLENGVLFLMGTPVAIDCDDAANRGGHGEGGCPKPDLDEVEIGQRVRVDPHGRVEMGEDEILAADKIRCWNGHGDRALGVVQAVRETDGGRWGIRVLDTWVEITDDTHIEFCDDDGGCHDDGDDD